MSLAFQSCMFKEASYARAEDECSSNQRALEEKRRYFLISYYVNLSTKSKRTVNYLAFPLVEFRKIWQIVIKYFTLVGARFSGISIRPVFWQR